MRPTLRKAIPDLQNSFVVRKIVGEKMENNWHYHAEYELLFIKKSCGVWLIGDHVHYFESGDIILIGPEVPHSFQHEDKYLIDTEAEQGEAVVAFFLPEMLGDTFMNLPELKKIKQTLECCKRGLKMLGTTKNKIGQIMKELDQESCGKKLIDLLYILQLIAEKNEYEVLVSNGYKFEPEKVNNDRLNSIFKYTYYNYHKQISIDEVASLVNMATHSFCRFFKEKTKKTYIEFLMEVRIGQACKLLIEEDMNAGEVGYSCGYNSISHFNHQFRTIKNKSPLEYKKNYIRLINANG